MGGACRFYPKQTSVILPQAENGVFALRNRASGLILVAGYACHAAAGRSAP
jgi:hypothetical protein